MLNYFKYFLLVLLLFTGFNMQASHFMGGEITWECLGNHNYRFFLKLYRECWGINFGNNETLSVANNPQIPQIIMTLISKTDMSPVCNPDTSFPHIHCYPTPGTPNTGAIEEWYYTSDAVYPNGVMLLGVPPPQGWIFSHKGFARNQSTNISNASSYGWCLRAIMYPYNGTPENPCFDNSPTFAEEPATVICTGYPFTYNHDAWDKDLDSLAYSWAPPLDSSGTPLPYVPGYSYNSPLPGPSANPSNVAATINPYTGEISFTSFTQGTFLTVVKVSSYKCGIKVAEIFREIQIVLLACGSNSPPVVTAPFGSYIYSDTVYAGALVTFPLTAIDTGLLPNGSPQTLTLYASGSEFGTNYTSDSTGCINPPCAILNPPPQPTIGLSGVGNVQTNFSWLTDCNPANAGCGTTSNVYNFVIKVQDDFCPAPAITVVTITVVVLVKPVLPPPQIRCASVDPSGDVTLSWATLHDTTNSFNSYHIYSSTIPGGPYTEIDSIFNINQGTYLHIGAGANTKPMYYFIKTRSGCKGMVYSSPSDTIQTIFLQALNSGNGTALISWNPLYNPNLVTSNGWYHIFREFPAGNWVMLDSTQALNYIDSITVCGAVINYYVTIGDQLPCTSMSSIGWDYFHDTTIPAILVIDSVSVDSLIGHSEIGWQPSSSGDVVGYFIYESKNGIWVKIDSVYGINTTSYVNALPTWSNPDSTALEYCVAAFDSCGNRSPLSPNHFSILLNAAPDMCGGGVTLFWSSYVNMTPSLQGYRVYARENNGPIQLLGTVGTSTQTYIHTPINLGSTYIYCIQAFNNTGTITATSNSDTVVTYGAVHTSFVYLRHVTVKNSRYVELKAIMDTTVYISHCKILRADSTGIFNVIGNVKLLPATNSISYDDKTAAVNQISYFYKVTVVDSCGNDVITSNIGRTIYLTATPVSDMNNILRWNDYQTWLGKDSIYNIYRSVDDVWDANPIITLPTGITTFPDDVSAYSKSSGKFSYMIKAVEGPGNPYLIADTSTSNVALALQYPRLYVPNAFHPKGINNIFLPINVFFDNEDYQFTVYDRWGAPLFYTTDINVGWDGKYKDVYVPQGVYVYSIRFLNAQNKYVEKRGTVTLLK